MAGFLFGDPPWLSSTPLILVGFLAALTVLAWDWRVSLPALLAVQLGVARLAVQRSLMPEQWVSVLTWVVVGSLLILTLSILQSSQSTRSGRWGTFVFRSLLLGLAGFLVLSADVEGLLPLLDSQMTYLLLWIGFCAIFAFSNADGALENGQAMLLWLIAVQPALIAIAPAAVVVVLLGTILLLVTLACAYLLVAENLALAAESRAITDITFPGQQAAEQSIMQRLSAAMRQTTASLDSTRQRGTQT